MYKAGLILALFLVLIFAPLVRLDRLARFWVAGMLMSLLPICAARQEDRNMFFVGLGAMGPLHRVSLQ